MSGRIELGIDERPDAVALLAAIKAALPELRALLQRCDDDWGYEDPVYRFYHQSFKVYAVQRATEAVVSALQALAPARALNEWFMRIVSEGMGRAFEREDNARWLDVTRPMLEAFFHARFMLEMVVRYGGELEAPPRLLPSGWGAVLYLYGLR